MSLVRSLGCDEHEIRDSLASAGTKGRRLRVYMHPPSIPTRFQTFHYETREPKAFNSTATRFGDHAHDLPGPGYYQTTGADTAYKIVSTGNAVISKVIGGWISVLSKK
ncbi:hypothetical protein BC832DRAFT_569642 [Gaertneriomyces semiglobifer]|nr:hypothetical protein BC832DRAFT_569642 [Gaertneriomyces semiglobifer]